MVYGTFVEERKFNCIFIRFNTEMRTLIFFQLNGTEQNLEFDLLVFYLSLFIEM